MGLADQVIHNVETQNVDVNAPLPYNGLTVFLVGQVYILVMIVSLIYNQKKKMPKY